MPSDLRWGRVCFVRCQFGFRSASCRSQYVLETSLILAGFGVVVDFQPKTSAFTGVISKHIGVNDLVGLADSTGNAAYRVLQGDPWYPAVQ